MLRISENTEKAGMIRVRLDGNLTVESYGDLEAVLTRYAGNGESKGMLLDMSGVVFMNDEVARKLAERRTAGLEIVNCSPYIEALLQTV